MTTAFVTFNLFYVFAGRPTLLGMPAAVQWLATALVAGISGLWLWRALPLVPESAAK